MAFYAIPGSSCCINGLPMFDVGIDYVQVPDPTTAPKNRVCIDNGDGTGRWEAYTPVPETVTKLQLIRALRSNGLKDAFDTAMVAADTETREDWDYCSVVERDDARVADIGSAIGLDASGLDALFVEAEGM